MMPIRALLGATRKFTTSAVARGGHGHHGGVIGSNLPFDISNRYKLTLYFILFFGSGFSLPFILVRHHLTK
ncbi:Cytochrome c oxidase subunit 7C like protein [Argiope bruennichi]|uniref:Cytochrome c oxidase subunit 7C, mitochondrial n=1 Tax=Argiope bruennichi TaxID=94029 RepID=A0A8T0EGN1_ARGBR|nr:Cytochrome c oxidase subunit 7C like protein [Argiope bruennichi]